MCTNEMTANSRKGRWLTADICVVIGAISVLDRGYLVLSVDLTALAGLVMALVLLFVRPISIKMVDEGDAGRNTGPRSVITRQKWGHRFGGKALEPRGPKRPIFGE